jgi:glycosyltransferase involved in cell wall biosynthesis
MQYEPWFKRKGETLDYKLFTPLRDADPPGWSYTLKKMTGLNEWRSSNFIKSLGRVPLLFSQSGYDLIWQNRLLQLHHFFWEKKIRKPVVFDFDDAIWINEGEKQVIKKIGISDMIFAGNEYLASFARKYNKNIHIVPTTIDTEKLFPLNKNAEQFIIGWIGTKSNFEYLEMIRKPLLDFLAVNQDARLMIVSAELPDFLNPGNKQVVFKQWTAEKENELINEFSVGIMPLSDNEWTRGKCSFKLLQYLACGKPAIASPVGMNNKILAEAEVGIAVRNNEEWFNALSKVKNEPAMAAAWGKAGRKLIEEKYSCSLWTDQIINLMKTII